MYRLRKEDSSLYLYLKDIILKDFIEFQEKDNLVYSTSLSSDSKAVYDIDTYLEPNPFEYGRGLAYFDDLTGVPLVCTTISGTTEQRDRVYLYDEDLTVIDDNSYIVDYITGRIITTPDVKPAYIDYYWHYVSLVDEWSAVTASKPPVVVIDVNSTVKKGFQLGGGKYTERKVSLIIFASSTAERNDLAEVLHDGLYQKSCPYYDFPEGTVLDFDGTFRGRRYTDDKTDNFFIRTTVSGVSNLRFENVVTKHVSLPIVMSKGKDEVALSDLNAYRSKITFDMTTYEG
jgi:hypothetical protein